MKKKFMIIAVTGICIGILSGCQETPKNSIVKQKSADNIKNYESVEDAETSQENQDPEKDKNSTKNQDAAKDENDIKNQDAQEKEGKINKMVQAPKTYKNRAEYEEGTLIIDTDAEIILPNVDSMNTYHVSAKEADQEMIDQITQIFFAGAKFYHGYDYNDWTKEDYQKDLTMLKKYKSEGNLDPFHWGTNDDGELAFDIDAAIADDEMHLETAPDEIEKKEVIPSFGLEWIDTSSGEPQTKVDDDMFYGIAETDHGVYGYNIYNQDQSSADVRILIQTQGEGKQNFREFNRTGWKDGRYALDREYLPNDGRDATHAIPEDTIKSFLKISYEDAEKIATEKIDQLGWNWKISGWDYSIYSSSYNIQKEDIQNAGYIFYFNRVLDEAPITFTDTYGGSLEDHDSTLIPWSYERCEVIVGNNGIEKVEIYNPYHIDGIQTENVKLMDFDSIIKIYEQMMEISNADMMNYYDKMLYHTTRITLGYSRIYDPTTDSTSGIIVPVWDFFGGFDAECEDYTEKNSGEHSKESFLTINAIDGTVIDRSLGY
ncbi:MAG: hypothetical protein HFH41_08800 [Lachnospiraceae bacterium]|nr:hypothetical protein [Lachnospiraceae bacterium]